MNSISVVHLVWHNLGIEPFRRFVESYRKHPAGIDHDLTFILKEFPDEFNFANHHKLLGNFQFDSWKMPGSWLDIPAYFAAVEHIQSPQVCFLNSNSEILADDWLLKLAGGLNIPGINLVGATGSHESLQNFGLRGFDRFPNCHLRTNAFICRRETFLAIPWRPGNVKEDCWRFESGSDGLSRSNGLGLVCGADGRLFNAEDWQSSNTFRTNGQENLLIADNQTRTYANASPEDRQRLTALAWGPIHLQ